MTLFQRYIHNTTSMYTHRPQSIHVRTYLHFLLVCDRAVGIFHYHEGRVLLFFKQEHALEHPVQVELQALVQLVHLPLYLVPDLLHLLYKKIKKPHTLVVR